MRRGPLLAVEAVAGALGLRARHGVHDDAELSSDSFQSRMNRPGLPLDVRGLIGRVSPPRVGGPQC